MTNLRRTIASTAAAVAIAAGLLAGFATPANAATAGFPPIPFPTPGNPGTPSLPPGTVIRPVVQLPACDNAVYPNTIWATQVNHPGFAYLGSSSGTIGASAAPLVSIALADRHITCVWGLGKNQLWITFTATTSADYATLSSWYTSHARYTIDGGGPTQPGVAADKLYILGDASPGAVVESAFLSPDGWWITAIDHRLDTTPYFLMDATEKFLELNPTRS
jgi:hypothetical protein